jgi:hypothetical protein
VRRRKPSEIFLLQLQSGAQISKVSGAFFVESFDLIVIGSDLAGEKGAAQAAYFAKRVALIECREVGRGSLPREKLSEWPTILECQLPIVSSSDLPAFP